jgi:hypothetical protein
MMQGIDRVRTVTPSNDTEAEDRFAKLLSAMERQSKAIERLVVVEERKLAAKSHEQRKAERSAGPTTEDALAYVERRMKKKARR